MEEVEKEEVSEERGRRGRVHKDYYSTCYASLQLSPNTAPASKPPMVAFI